MVYIKQNASTLKQEAYARRVWGSGGENKKEIALDVGYSENIANNPKNKIENTLGFRNAISKIAEQSNNAACKILNEFERRDFKEYSNKDLNNALNSIASAWDKFNPKEERPEGGTNRLRSIVLQRIENQTVNNTTPAEVEVKSIDDDDDF